MSLESYLKVVNDYLEIIKIIDKPELFKDDVADIVEELIASGDDTAYQVAIIIKLLYN